MSVGQRARNKRIKAAWLILCLAAPAVLCLVFACSLPMGGNASFSITIGGGKGRTILPWDPEQTDIEISELNHTITLTGGPEPDIRRENIKAGDTVQFSVSPGHWEIIVQAYLGSALKAEGFASVNVKPGHNGAIPITMGKPRTFEITMQDDGNGEATATPNPAAIGDTVTIQAVSNNGFMFKEWQIISGHVTLSDKMTTPATFTMPSSPVTIKAEFKEVPSNTPYLSMLPVIFEDVTVGYEQPASKTVTISNTGNVKADISSITLDGEDRESFILDSANSTKSIPAEGTTTFLINTITGLEAKIYTATITVTYSGGNVNYAVAETYVSFTVHPIPLGSSPDNPFLVHNETDLLHVGKPDLTHSGWTLDKHYKQTADITLSGTWTPIGSGYFEYVEYFSGNLEEIIGISFTGSYDGGDFTISDLTIYSPSDDGLGLFSAISDNAVVKNLRIENCDIKGNCHVGGVVGWNNGGTVIDCYVQGSVTGFANIGGVVGKNGGTYINENCGTVEKCNTKGKVEASGIWSDRAAGGVVGYNNGTVKDCHSIADVSGFGHIGGVVGANYIMVQNCYATGKVLGTCQIGGVLGHNDYNATVRNCYATGDVEGIDFTSPSNSVSTSSNVGGLVGDNADGSTVENCYALGNVSGTDKVGGVVGSNNRGVVQNCYATGNVSGNNNYSASVGGVVGDIFSGMVQNCYATGNVSIITANPNGGYVGGVVGLSNNTVLLKNNVALNMNLSINGSNIKTGRVAGIKNNDTIIENNYGRNDMKKSNGAGGWTSEVIGKDGKDITEGDWNSATWWIGIALFSEAVWNIENGKLPTLRYMPDETLRPQNPVVK